MALGALVLAGGRSRRMGADKAGLDWGGRSARELCVAVAEAVGADPVLTVGGVGEVPDDLSGAGPVGGVMAGARALRQAGCDRALVLAVDAPTLLPQDFAPLLAAASPGAAYEGLPLPMVVDLDALPADAEAGWPLGRLVERAGLARPACPAEAAARLRGANTPAERALLLGGPGARQGGGD